MSMIDYSKREINCKIVYVGPSRSGRATNLEHIYQHLDPAIRGKLIRLHTEPSNTLFFDFRVPEFTIRAPHDEEFGVRFHLYTVPGQAYYHASRKLILKGVDGIVFVADSHPERMDANVVAMHDLYENMAHYPYMVTKLPFVVQYNKRDLPKAAPIPELQGELNPGWPVDDWKQQRVVRDNRPGHVGEMLVEQTSDGSWIERAPYAEAVASRGEGVLESLRLVAHLVIRTLR